MQFFDIGANLTHSAFAADLERTLERARQAGVGQIIVTGTTVEETAAAIRSPSGSGFTPPPACIRTTRAIAGRRRFRPCASWRSTRASSRSANAASTSTATTRRIRTRRNGSSRSSSSACRSDKPLFLHSRDAHPRFSRDPESTTHVKKAVAHCFTGERDELRAYLDLGLYVGITGWICDERRGKHLVELVQGNPREPAAARDRRALPHAARPQAAAEGAAQRARVPAAYRCAPWRARSGGRPRKSPPRPRATHDSSSSAA